MGSSSLVQALNWGEGETTTGSLGGPPSGSMDSWNIASATRKHPSFDSSKEDSGNMGITGKGRRKVPQGSHNLFEPSNIFDQSNQGPAEDWPSDEPAIPKQGNIYIYIYIYSRFKTKGRVQATDNLWRPSSF